MILRIFPNAAKHCSRCSDVSGPDIGIFPHAVEQRFNWPATEAVNVTLNFPNEKSPLSCSLSSKFFDHMLLLHITRKCFHWYNKQVYGTTNQFMKETGFVPSH